MGVNKTPDGRTEVGRGIENGNHYKGFATKREIMIQLTADGATAESLDALEYLKTYALYHGAQGEPVMPPTTRVFISNNGTTKAVEADEITITDSGINIGGCVWNGEAWDFSGAGQGGGGGSDLPEVTADDKDKYLHTNSSTGNLEWSAVSGGGGVTTVEASNDGVLNKTWQQINDAGFCVLKNSGELGIAYNILVSVDHDMDGYYVTFFSGENWYTFITSTANDYPVISNEP